MEITLTLAYAMGLSGLLTLMVLAPYVHLALRHACPLVLYVFKVPPVPKLWSWIRDWTKKHLIDRQFLKKGRLLHAWSRRDAILFLAYLITNLCVLYIDLPTMSAASGRAGSLALINMLVLYAGPSMSLQARVLHMSRRMQRRVHACIGLIVCCLVVFHAMVELASRREGASEGKQQLWRFLGLSTGCALLLPMGLFRKHLAKEILYYGHYLLSSLFLYAVWCHLPAEGLLPRLYMYVIAGVLLAMALLRAVVLTVLFRKDFQLCRAEVSHPSGSTQITVHLRRPVKVEPGQYIHLWTLVSPLSVFTRLLLPSESWSDEPREKLKVPIQPYEEPDRSYVRPVGDSSTTSIAAVSGPHGSQPAAVLIVATGPGIAKVTSALKGLIHEHHAYRVQIERVHVVWQVEDPAIGLAFEQSLNEALDVDKGMRDRMCDSCDLKHESIMKISVFLGLARSSRHILGTRVIEYPGVIDFNQLITDEVKTRRGKNSVLVLASVSKAERKTLAMAMAEHAGSATLIDMAHQT